MNGHFDPVEGAMYINLTYCKIIGGPQYIIKLGGGGASAYFRKNLGKFLEILMVSDKTIHKASRIQKRVCNSTNKTYVSDFFFSDKTIHKASRIHYLPKLYFGFNMTTFFITSGMVKITVLQG